MTIIARRLEMTVKLYEPGYTHARSLIEAGKAVLDERDAWSEHQPSARAENDFIRDHGWDEFARWHLAIDDSEDEDTKARYKFPYGDFEAVHRCAVLSAEVRAAQYDHVDVEVAAAHLHGLLDELRVKTAPAGAGTRGP
jgi:hypothetical protein